MVAKSNSTLIAIKNRLSSRVEDTTEGCLYFMYSMAGALSAELKVYTSTDGLETLKFYSSGMNKVVDQWYEGFIPIETGKYAVVFEAITRAYDKYFPGTVAIDDITWKGDSCPSIG